MALCLTFATLVLMKEVKWMFLIGGYWGEGSRMALLAFVFSTHSSGCARASGLAKDQMRRL
jgi:hypothetical protein